jgi:hypothetical protein
MTYQQVIERKNKSIDSLIKDLDDRVATAEFRLNEVVINDFLKKLERKNGVILNNRSNKRLMAVLDRVINNFNVRENGAIIKKLVDGIGEIIDINSEYYADFLAKKTNVEIANSARKEIKQMLGFAESGKLIKNGYLDRLYQMPDVKQKVRSVAINSIVRGDGWTDARDRLQSLVLGDQRRYGAMRGYYRNFAYDAYAEADAITGNVFADELGLQFAIYEGGVIKTTRDFCRSHNGKIFHISQIMKFQPKEAIPDNYDPLRHRGGYGCRHHYNWISDELALALDPALKKFVV